MIQTQLQAQSRKQRRPNFPMAGTMKPFGLYPLWGHPVLPGETVQAVTNKMRVLSMPLRHPLGGAWLETWLVYVKLTDINVNLGQMFISDTYSTSGFTAAANSDRYFVRSGQIDWMRLATEAIHKAYFVHDNETPRALDGVPQIKVNNVSWYQNCMFQPTDTAVPVTDATDTYEHLSGWMMLQQMGMTELTYDKYLETYGVTPVRSRMNDPEILQFNRAWTQPTNSVDPVTGAPSSAWAWSADFNWSKPKRFDEPGFLVMLGAVRPKVFQQGVRYSFLGNLWGFTDWFPSYNLPDPTAGVREILSTDPVYNATAQDAGTKTLVYDHRDLLSHGEQFVNDWSDTPYRLPWSTGLEVKTASQPEDMRGEYVKSADVDNLFTVATTTKTCYYEGMTGVTISGHVMDTTR